MKPYNEIRLDDEGNPDDIVIYDTHIERMSPNVWWLAVYKGDKKTTFHIMADTKISVEIVTNGLKTKEI